MLELCFGEKTVNVELTREELQTLIDENNRKKANRNLSKAFQ